MEQAIKNKCQDCGGQLKLHKYGVLKCEKCNNIVQLNDVHDINKLNKANNLRLNKKFAESLEIYREIIEIDEYNPEANWGAFLSQYGIEYVSDNNKLLPTIYRPIQTFKFTEDNYIINLLKGVSGSEYQEYLEKIEALEELRLKIESKKYEKYDIFISCKITVPEVEVETKTDEYKWGKQIYDKLNSPKLKVFFSPRSLPSTNSAYEPIIYNALQSAKYLIVLASKAEYLESTWIKNEWSRFLDIKKNTTSEKYIKLIINSDVSKGVPNALKAVSSHIERDSDDWLYDLVKALEEVFPEQVSLINTKRFQHNDLELIEKNNKKYMPKRIATLFFGDSRESLNRYTPSLRHLNNSYELQENDLSCSLKVKAHLKNKRFDLAAYELNEYLNYIGKYNDLNYGLTTLKLLIDSESVSLLDFFETKIKDYRNLDLLKEIIDKVSQDTQQEFLNPLCDYIIKSVKNRMNDNVLPLYQHIISINIDAVISLRKELFSSLSLMKKNPNLIIDLADMTIPYVASENLHDFINIATQLSTKFIESNLFEPAQYFVDQVLLSDGQNSRCLLNQMLIKYKVNNDTQLLNLLSNVNEYVEIANLVPELNENGVNKIVNIIKKTVNQLIDEERYDVAASWIDNVLSRTYFNDSDKFFRSIIDRCLTLPNSTYLFRSCVETIDEAHFDYYIEVNTLFIKLLITNKMYDHAKQLCKEVIQYDMTNQNLLNYYLFAEIESPIGNYKHINKLTNLTIVELMYHCYKTESEKISVLIQFMNKCIQFIKDNEVSVDDNIFTLFDSLIDYTPNLDENFAIIRKIHDFSSKLIQKGMFSKAIDYYEALINLNEKDHAAYWGLLLATNHCKSEDDMITHNIKLVKNKEYELAVHYANENKFKQEEYLNWYSKVLAHNKNIKTLKTRKVGMFLLVLILVTVLLIFIGD